MRQMSLGLLTISLFYSLLSGATPPPLAASMRNDLPASFNQVVEWKNLGSTWELGFGKNHEPIAIFDLSYQDPQARIFLACLDFKCANSGQVVNLIREHKAKLSPYSTEFSLYDSHETDEALDTLLKLEAEAKKKPTHQQDSILPAHWWKTVPWKKTRGLSALAGADAPPTRFFLSDIDFAELTGPRLKQFEKNLTTLIGTPEALGGFEYVGNSTGGYRLFWNPQKNGGRALTPPLPYKLADLQCPECALVEVFSSDILNRIIEELIGAIPVPVVSALLSTALGEWMHLRREMTLFHQQRLLEVLQSARDLQTDPSLMLTTPALAPFLALSQKTLDAATSYILYAQSNIIGSAHWLIEKPMEVWKRQEEGAKAQAKDTRSYLNRQGYGLRFLNSRNVVATNAAHESWIYPLSTNRYWNIVSPFVAIDYQKPKKIMIERLTIESAHVFVDILARTIPIPGVGTAISQLYERIVHSQMHAVEQWEGRLEGHLSLRQQQGEKWTQEMNSLRNQAANPLIPTYEESQARVRAEKTYYQIP